MQESDSLVVHHHHHHYYAVQVNADGIVQGVDGGSLQELLERRSRAAERGWLTVADDYPKVFINQCCQLGEDLFVTVSDLTRAFDWWIKQNHGRRAIQRKALNEGLLAHGLRSGRVRIGSRQSRIWTGASLRAEIVAAVESGSELSLASGVPQPSSDEASSLPSIAESSESFMQFALRNHAAIGAAMAKHLQSGFGLAHGEIQDVG
jgi:hypothetical protein